MIDIIKHPIFMYSLIFLVASGLLLWIVSFFVASYIVYNKTLRRKDKNQWSRDIPSDISHDSVEMYKIGLDWSKENASFKEDVHIINNGLNLYGEYYNFGKERCVIILSGRTECLKYGYYFAIPYSKKCNVLVIDPRAHGLSDGEFNTIGFEESKDIIEWVNFIVNEKKIKSIIFHGICIGAAGGMLALTSEECPDCIEGFVTEGMFPNFKESMKNHLIERKKPATIITYLINKLMIHYTGHSMDFGPIDVIHKMNKPLLMLHSREDLYSTPEYAQKLYELAGSEKKKIVWFEKGKHSFLRITDTKKYDESINDFLENTLMIK